LLQLLDQFNISISHLNHELNLWTQCQVFANHTSFRDIKRERPKVMERDHVLVNKIVVEERYLLRMTRTPPCWQAVLHETRLPTPLLFCCPTQKRYTTSSRKIHRRQPKKRREMIVEGTNRYDGGLLGGAWAKRWNVVVHFRCQICLLAPARRHGAFATTLVENCSQPRNEKNTGMNQRRLLARSRLFHKAGSKLGAVPPPLSSDDSRSFGPILPLVLLKKLRVRLAFRRSLSSLLFQLNRGWLIAVVKRSVGRSGVNGSFNDASFRDRQTGWSIESRLSRIRSIRSAAKRAVASSSLRVRKRGGMIVLSRYFLRTRSRLWTCLRDGTSVVIRWIEGKEKK